MGSPPNKGIFAWLKSLLSAKKAAQSEMDQARTLIDAIDRGGIPLNPARVNAIARGLGLEVSRHAPVDKTIQRIRAAIGRAS